MYLKLLVTLFCFCNSLVNAIFTDEAFSTDWLLQTIGDYNCVLSDSKIANGQLIILSHFSENESLISYVNETSGEVISRNVIPYKTSDAMYFSETNKLILQLENSKEGNFKVVDLVSGLLLDENVEEEGKLKFSSSCHPTASNFRIEKNHLKILDEDKNLAIFNIELPSDFEELNYIDTDYTNNLRLLITTEGSKYTYLNYTDGGNKLVNSWSRDEDIIDIIDSTFCELKDHSFDMIAEELIHEQNIRNTFEAYLFRITTNIKRFINLVERNNYSPGKVMTEILSLGEIVGKVDEVTVLKRNLKFGLAKLLVVLTKNGKFAAFDVSQGGKMLWSVKTDLTEVKSIYYNAEEQQYEIISKDGSYGVYTSVYEFLAPNLKRHGKFKLSSRSSIQSVKSVDSNGSYLIKLENGRNQIVSVNEVSQQSAEQLYVTDHNEKSINGYKVDDSSKLLETWKIEVNEDEEIVAFASRTTDPVVSIGSVLGNRTVLYKYLYPNLVSYAVVNKVKNSLYVNLLDSITGELLYSQKHSNETINVNSPVNIVFGENWYIYTYFSSEPIPEQKITVVELYESLEADQRVSSADIDYNPLKGNINKPKVMTRSYFFPEIIADISLSTTKFSISAKSIIVKLANGQLIYIPKFVMNARSKVESEMSDDDKKEFMASPYLPIIPVNDHYVISHQRELLMGETSKIVSTSTNLESTSIICEVGHDIFCTRISPSGQFDVMNPSFEKGKLLGTIFIIIVICFYLRPGVAKKKIKTLWLIKD